jgi:hypothetical protein
MTCRPSTSMSWPAPAAAAGCGSSLLCRILSPCRPSSPTAPARAPPSLRARPHPPPPRSRSPAARRCPCPSDARSRPAAPTPCPRPRSGAGWLRVKERSGRRSSPSRPAFSPSRRTRRRFPGGRAWVPQGAEGPAPGGEWRLYRLCASGNAAAENSFRLTSTGFADPDAKAPPRNTTAWVGRIGERRCPVRCRTWLSRDGRASHLHFTTRRGY